MGTGPEGWVASGKFYESILLKPGVCALGALHEQFCKLFESVTVHTPVHMRGVLQRVVPEVDRSRGRSFLPCYYRGAQGPARGHKLCVVDLHVWGRWVCMWPGRPTPRALYHQMKRGFAAFNFNSSFRSF